MGKGKHVKHVRRAGDAVESQFERLQRIWGRLAGSSAVPQDSYTKNGVLVGAGVALATVILFVGRAEVRRRADKRQPEADANSTD